MTPMQYDAALVAASGAVDFSPPENTAPRAAVMRKFNCANCGGEIAIRATGHTLTAICEHCSSVIDATDERLLTVQDVNKRVRATLLEIGQRGIIDGIHFEIVGYMQKSDKTKMYFWEEYLLFNPYHGFRFLVQMDGHWNYVTILKREIQKPGFVCTVWVDDNKFQPFLQDQPIVQYVKGEFYWRVKKGDRAKTEDYVCPPYMLSIETADGDTTVSMCAYKEPKEIADAFDLTTSSMPRRTGVGPNQPLPYPRAGVMRVASIALALLVLFQILFCATASDVRLVNVQAVHQAGDQAKTFTTAPFEIPKRSNVLIQSFSNVSNSWVELYVTLVNEQTQEIFEVRQPIEYYSGSDSDGPWTEGSTNASDYMSGVPPGMYRLVYELDADAFSRRYMTSGAVDPVATRVTLTIAATRDVASWGNFWLTALLILICPVYIMLRSVGFENQRWENSDFPRGNS